MRSSHSDFLLLSPDKTFRVIAASCALMGTLSSAAPAQPVSPTAPIGVAASQPGRTLDLKQQTALRVPVSFEARRRPLSEVLADLQRQGGVELSAGEPAKIADFKVTAHVEALPLAEVLLSLARLYGFEWDKNGEAYVIISPGAVGLDHSLLQLGAPDSIEQQSHLQSWRERQGIDWLQQVTQFTTETELRAGQGVPLTAMAPELQTRLRHPIELPAAARLVGAYAQAIPGVIEENRLRVTVLAASQTATANQETLSPVTAIVLVNSAGKQVAPIAKISPATPSAPSKAQGRTETP